MFHNVVACTKRCVQLVQTVFFKDSIVHWTLGVHQWRYNPPLSKLRSWWQNAAGEVGHHDPWEQIWWERERGDAVEFRWVPSHLGVKGRINWLKKRKNCTYNEPPLEECQRVEEIWDQLGLEELHTPSVSSLSSHEGSE